MKEFEIPKTRSSKTTFEEKLKAYYAELKRELQLLNLLTKNSQNRQP